MKLWVKIMLGIVATVIVAIGALVIWQWDNIKALYVASTSSSQEVKQLVDDVSRKQDKVLKEGYGVTIPAINSTQSDEIFKGTVSAETAKEQIGIQPQEKAPSQSETKADKKTGEKKPTAPKPKKLTAQEITNLCVSELYACEIDLMARLGKLFRETEARWEALPPGGRNGESKAEFAMEGLNKCYALEVETDTNVKSILDKYRKKLAEIKADDSVMNELWKLYCEKKASQKAYYLNEYLYS